MTDHWTSLLSLILSLSILLPALIGWGGLFSKYFIRSNCDVHRQLAHQGLIGLFVAGSVSLFVNLIVPISSQVTGAFSAIGIILFFTLFRPLSIHKTSLLLLFAFALVFSSFTGYMATNNDTYLSQFPTVNWIHNEVLPVGLANLNVEFVLNFFSNSIISMFWLPYLEHYSVFSANLIFSILCFSALGEILAADTNKKQLRASTFLCAFVLLCFFSFDPLGSLNEILFRLPSLTPDILGNLLICLCGVYVLKVIEDNDINTCTNHTKVILLFAFTAAMTKLPNVMVLAIPLALVIKDWRRIREYKVLTAVLGVFALWTTTGLILSGCLWFPGTNTCPQNLEWALNPISAENWRKSATSFARALQRPSEIMTQIDNAWLSAWFDHHWHKAYFRMLTFLIPLGLVATLITLVNSVRSNTLPPKTKALFFFYAQWLVILVALAIWFVLIPTPRFAIGFLLLASFWGLSVIAARLVQKTQKPVHRIFQVGLICWVLASSANSVLESISKGQKWHWPQLFSKKVYPYKNSQDITFYSPAQYEGEYKDMCWDELLCAPTINFSHLKIQLWGGRKVFLSH